MVRTCNCALFTAYSSVADLMKGSNGCSLALLGSAFYVLAAAPATAEFPSDVRTWMDESAQPCDDFYEYVCGNFVKMNSTDNVDVVSRGQGNLDATIKRILADTSNEAGKLYASCMNTERIEEHGTAPLWCELNKLKDITTHDELLTFAAKLSVEGTAPFVDFDVDPEPKNVTRNSLQLKMPALPVPTNVNESQRVSKALKTYVATILNTTGDWNGHDVISNADGVVELIKKFVPLSTDYDAVISPERVDEMYPAMTVTEAAVKFPLLGRTFFSQLEPLADDIPVFLLSPNYFAEGEAIIKMTDIEVLKAYVNFHIVHSKIDSLPKNLRHAAHVFRGDGDSVESLSDRSSKCTEVVENILPNALSKLVVEAWHGEGGVETTKPMLDSLLPIMVERVQGAEWLSEQTRAAIVKKVAATAKLVGGPEGVEAFNFDEHEVFLTNMEHAKRLSTKRKIELTGKPVDRSKWWLTGAQTNAFNLRLVNQVIIPVGHLQTPLFNATYHPVRNFAGVGYTAGHEIIHGFDSDGRYHDENGSIGRWWTDADYEEFDRRSKCFVDQYSSLKLVDDQGNYLANNDGSSTLAENIADNGGLKLAFQGYKAFATKNPNMLKGFELSKDEIDQLFFISLAQDSCQKLTADDIEYVAGSTHSIGSARVNGMMMNSKDFSEAFQCPVGSAMNPEKKCEIW